MSPILDGESGFVLLALVVGLGAYVRQVYVDSEATYDKVKVGELNKLWTVDPVEAPYTTELLANLEYVQTNLIRATGYVFFFLCVVVA